MARAFGHKVLVVFGLWAGFAWQYATKAHSGLRDVNNFRVYVPKGFNWGIWITRTEIKIFTSF